MALTSKEYHQLTSYQRDKMPRHFLDWQNQPSTFKTYPDNELIHLPRDVQHGNEKLSKIFKYSQANDSVCIPHVDDLPRILSLAYTITSKAPHGDGFYYYRSVASAGALYPVEIYVATHDVKGLQDGLYHFSIANHALVLLRNEDVSGFVADSLQETPKNRPSLIFLLTAIFFRSAWKYKERAYRYHLLDTGHLIENLVLALKAQRLPFFLSYDFDDHEFNRLLGLDETKEICLAVCHVPGPHIFRKDDERKDVSELGDSIKVASRVSNKEIEYLAIRDIHKAGMLQKSDLRAAFPEISPVEIPKGRTIEIKTTDTWPEKMNHKEAFLFRRSRRNFIPKPVSHSCLMALLESLNINDPASASESDGDQNSISMGLIIGNVDGFEPGFYLMNRSKRSLQMVSEGRFTDLMAHICLDQRWLANAAIHFLFVTDIEALDRSWGARGYRYAMMTSGRLGERLYLAATAMGLGCCGIGAFYDAEASQLLGLTKESRLFYLVAVGLIKSSER
jgi:SagB-type dehydrogenase family enzyme